MCWCLFFDRVARGKWTDYFGLDMLCAHIISLKTPGRLVLELMTTLYPVKVGSFEQLSF